MLITHDVPMLIMMLHMMSVAVRESGRIGRTLPQHHAGPSNLQKHHCHHMKGRLGSCSLHCQVRSLKSREQCLDWETKATL